MLRIAICDDNNSICSAIEQVILDYQKKFSVKLDVSVFYTGEDLLNHIIFEHRFDLIFLDIELGITTGIAVGSKIRYELDDYISKIVFITSKNGYEYQLFDVQPLNFLKKPIDNIRLIRCIELAIRLLNLENQTFEYKQGNSIVKVKVRDIIYFEKVGKKIKLVTTDGIDLFNESMVNIKKKATPNFIESHESFFVNFDRIRVLKKDIIIMSNTHEIPVSRRNISNIRDMLMKLEKEK